MFNVHGDLNQVSHSTHKAVGIFRTIPTTPIKEKLTGYLTIFMMLARAITTITVLGVVAQACSAPRSKFEHHYKDNLIIFSS